MMMISGAVEVARTRWLVKRRQSKPAPPISVRTPQTPPSTIAICCLTAMGKNQAYIQCGVNMPNRWPKKMPSMPIWNRFDQITIPRLSSIWLEEARQVYWP